MIWEAFFLSIKQNIKRGCFKGKTNHMPEYKIKRAYSLQEPSDGFRVYIDRLWPQGLSHATFHYDLWDKDIAPSAELREWFHADPENRWQEFEKKYIEELKNNPAFQSLKELLASKTVVTLLYSSRNEEHNNAVVLYNVLTSNNK